MLNCEGLNSNEKIEVSILNIFGDTNAKVFLNSKHPYIDISQLPRGIYFVQVKQNQYKIVKKLFKE